MQHDEFQYLENLDTPEVQDWVAQHNAATQQQLDQDPRFTPLKDAILAHIQDTRQIPFFAEHAGWYYNFHQDAEHVRGIYRRIRPADYLKDDSSLWETVIDLDGLAAQANKNWYLEGVSHYTQAPSRAMIHLSVEGGDAVKIKEYDLEQKAWVDNGFEFPVGKNHVAWQTQDSVWVCPAWKGAPVSDAGYPLTVWRVKRDPVDGLVWQQIFEAEPDAMMVAAWRYLDQDETPLDIIEVSSSFYSKTYYQVLNDDGDLLALPLHEKADIEAYFDQRLIVKLAEDWVWQEQAWQAGDLLALPLLKDGQLGAAELILRPHAHQSIEAVEPTLHALVVNVLDDIQSRLLAYHRQANHDWQAEELPVPTQGVIELSDQPWRTDRLYFSYSDFLTPTGLYCLDVKTQQCDLLRAQPAAFDASPYEVKLWRAQAEDGVEIPYFIVKKQGDAIKAAPTLLYGYGGFEVSMLPYYIENFGPHWLDKGGVFVLACIRGGGEYGPQWHQAAQGKNKPVSFADFAAVAKDLIDRGITDSDKLAIEGGSNGGLLVGACLIRYPALFKAVVCEVPLLDMLRYHRLLAGASWVDEYGDPEDPIEAEALAKYSPYHQVQAGQNYPSVLFLTNAKDDRVHPAHARKMVAKMESMGYTPWFFESEEGGHTGLSNQEQTAQELARVLIYLYQTIMD